MIAPVRSNDACCTLRIDRSLSNSLRLYNQGRLHWMDEATGGDIHIERGAVAVEDPTFTLRVEEGLRGRFSVPG